MKVVQLEKVCFPAEANSIFKCNLLLIKEAMEFEIIYCGLINRNFNLQ